MSCIGLSMSGAVQYPQAEAAAQKAHPWLATAKCISVLGIWVVAMVASTVGLPSTAFTWSIAGLGVANILLSFAMGKLEKRKTGLLIGLVLQTLVVAMALLSGYTPLPQRIASWIISASMIGMVSSGIFCLRIGTNKFFKGEKHGSTS